MVSLRRSCARSILLSSGLTGLFGRSWGPRVLAPVCILAIALDLYTVHFVIMPYYTGMIAHGPSGSLHSIPATMLVSHTGVIFRKAGFDEPAGIGGAAVAILWAAYLCSTVLLMAIAIFAGFARG